jgi:hypothetical protein
MENKDLVTGTPIKHSFVQRVDSAIPAYWKDILTGLQRIIMIVLTIVFIVVLNQTNIEIGKLKEETKRIATIAENGCKIAEQTRQEIYQQIEEIQKYGIKFHIKFW